MEKPRPLRGIPEEKGKIIWKQRLLKFLKLLKFFVISSMILTLLEITVGYWMLSSRWKIYLSKEQVQEFASEVDAAPPLPENFKRIYKVFYPEDFYASMSEQIFLNYGYRLIFRDPNIDVRPHCHCYFVYDIQRLLNRKLRDIDWTGRLEEFEYGFALEKYSTPEKCMDYATGYRIEELKATLNPDEYWNLIAKPVREMTDDELIELILLLKDRVKFDRTRFPETFEKAFLEYKVKVEEQANRAANLN